MVPESARALQDAAHEAQGFQLNEQGEPEAPPPPPPGYVPGDEAMREVERPKRGRRGNAYPAIFREQHREQRTDYAWHQSDGPGKQGCQWVIDNESAYAPQIMEKLADNPKPCSNSPRCRQIRGTVGLVL